MTHKNEINLSEKGKMGSSFKKNKDDYQWVLKLDVDDIISNHY